MIMRYFFSASDTEEVLLFVVCPIQILIILLADDYDIIWFGLFNILYIYTYQDHVCFTNSLFWHYQDIAVLHDVYIDNPILCISHTNCSDLTRSCVFTNRLFWHNQSLSVLHTIYYDITRSCLLYSAISAYNIITSCTYIFTTVLVSIFYRNIW